MILRMYSVRDKAVDAFLQPFFVRAKGEAVRSFLDAVSNNAQFRSHPHDYDLYDIGKFDDNTGLLMPNESPVLELTGLQALERTSVVPE